MKILKGIFNEINSLISDIPPEIGGILGSNNGDCITNFVMDKIECPMMHCCRYEPNVSFLNKWISKWQKNEIYFKGIFHTHFAGVKTLSCADKRYVIRIMKNMPNEIEELYFPIFVIPNREFICYTAKKKQGEIKILYEDIIFI